MTAATKEMNAAAPTAPVDAARLRPEVAPLPAAYLARNLVGWAWILFTCLFVGPPVIATMFVLYPFGLSSRFGDWVVWWWIAALRWLWGVEVVVDGLEHVEPGGPYVVVANHRSHLDPPACILGLRSRLRFGFIMKRSLSWIPVWGWFTVLNGYVPVDRSGKRSTKDQLAGPARQVSNGRSVMIFPEGHRAPDHRFLAFKRGAAVLALRAQVPLLPVVVSGTGRLWPRKSWFIRPGRVRVEVLPPIPTKGLSMDDRDRLMDALRDAISRRYRTGADDPALESDTQLLEALTASIGRRDRPEI